MDKVVLSSPVVSKISVKVFVLSPKFPFKSLALTLLMEIKNNTIKINIINDIFFLLKLFE